MIAIALVLQATFGIVSGTVRDERTGEPLAGATVTLPALRRSIITDHAERYTLTQVPDGSHQIVVRFIGYAPRALTALVPDGGALEISVALRAEPVTLDVLDVTESLERSAFPDRGIALAALGSDNGPDSTTKTTMTLRTNVSPRGE